MKVADIRVGHGYDVHRFADSSASTKPLLLGGITIPFGRALEAHSDGDLLLHALCDALLGAMGKGDIGQHFPDDDPRFANADSSLFLSQIIDLLASDNWLLGNTDITVVAQAPKLAPYRVAIASNIAKLLGIATDRVNVKATTTERMGFTGREEGLACYAVVLLIRNE